MMKLVRWFLVAAIAAFAALPHAAQAGTYTVVSCADPATGQPLGPGMPAGWEVNDQAPAERNWRVVSTCERGGSVTLISTDAGGQMAKDRFASLIFRAPPDTRIVGYELWRATIALPVNGSPFGVGTGDQAFPAGGDHYVEDCHGATQACLLGDAHDEKAFDPANHVAAGGSFKAVFGLLRCEAASCPRNETAAYRLFSARLTLDDSAAPVFAAAPSGDLLDSRVAGVRTVRFQAADRGGGLRRARILVDGRSLVEGGFDRGDGLCAAPRVTAPVPCPLRSEASLALDTAQVPDGPHDVAVRVEDVAGNATEHVARGVVFTGQAASRGAPNGSPADERARLTARIGRRTRLRSRAGRRHTLSGRLTTAAGQPIAGARLSLQRRLRRTGTAFAGRAGATTDRNGRFRVRVRARTSATLRVAYTAYANDRTPAAKADVRLRVPARARLSARPRRVRNHGRVRFSGRLLGGSVPRGGKVVEIQAREGRRRWQVFRTVRANRRGRFRTSYRFRNSPRAHAIRFRVRVRRDSTYPFELGYSKSVRVVAGG